MARAIKIATFTATTNGSTAVPTGTHPTVSGQVGHTYLLEVSSVGTSDTWNEDVLWVGPAANVTQLGTFANVTNVTNKSFTWVAAGTAGMAAPAATHIRYTLQTAGSSSIAGNLYIITDNF